MTVVVNVVIIIWLSCLTRFSTAAVFFLKKKHAILFPEYFASTHHKKQKKPKGKRKKEKNERFPASSTPAERTNRKILTIEQMYAYLS